MTFASQARGSGFDSLAGDQFILEWRSGSAVPLHGNGREFKSLLEDQNLHGILVA